MHNQLRYPTSVVKMVSLLFANLSECAESPLEPEEDEDEDVDFNPFMQGIPSPEASSSLSSEIEGLDGDVVESMGNTFASMGINLSKLTTSEVQCSAVGDSDHGEDESVMQTTISPGGTCEKELETNVSGKLKRRKFVLMSQPEIMTVREKEKWLEHWNWSC
ncbi:hypothetical protein L1049_023193 [Liquidambar formosana]|uniref:Uncharacterized protein n=1 Tax=Liquidambar formosana TaxID=63359 RepID=A0AAP0WQ01_LIQFO